jgi:putative ABC transport system permease protein
MFLLLQNTVDTQSPTADVSWINLVLAAGLILIAIGISRWQSLGLAKDLFVGAVRSVVQLILVGYVLIYVFATDYWYVTIAALLVMLIAATRATVKKRENKAEKHRLQLITGSAMMIGSAFTLFYVGTLVVHVTPWHNPRYLIPLFGMIVGSAMNGAAIAIDRFEGEMTMRRGEVEAYLALGADIRQASAICVRQALRAALIPTINGLMVIGIVTLPGMMTGQILAGASPLVAVRYQIVVVFMQAAAVSITTWLITRWYQKSFFNSALQLQHINS